MTPSASQSSAGTPVVNDFTIAVATVNGSGSASSNTILTKTIFRMGVPVAPKNAFPSNIAGLPTWFIIRVNEQGYKARTGHREVVIALNPATVVDDIASLDPGGVLIIDEAMPQAKEPGRDDIKVFSVPMGQISKEFAPDVRLRKLLANMVYVGVAAELLGLDREVIAAVVADQFASKEKVVKLNLDVVDAGIAYAREHFNAGDCPFKIEARDLVGDAILIEGNQATALGALMAGCSFLAWYPITPSSSVCEEFIKFCKRYRMDGEQANYAALQAEDELASIGMVLGAGWAGARSMTATSGPGISLMSELVGFGYYAEIPAVIVDVQRVGPSTGMPTRTQQCDISFCASLSHGDTGHILILPTGPEELFELTQEAFDIAERYQTPVFLMTDLDMGMNLWVSKRFEYPTKAFDRGKVLDAAALKTVEEYARYKDVDGDGIPYRTLPGTHHPKASYFTRGSGHTEMGEYTEDSEQYRIVVDRIKRKIDSSIKHTPKPVIDGEGEVGIIHYGSSSFAVDEARDKLTAEGMPTRSLRIRALPLHDEVVEFVQSCRVVYVVEQNRDGQMADILRLKVPGSAGKISKVLHYNGLPLACSVVEQAILAGEREPAHA
jgi:2-oxoglutarate ferredoxin oxidoreductase subunit alpha